MYRRIEDLKDKLHGKSVALRIDANVPIVEGIITDDARLVEALPSIKFLLQHGASKLFILSHFGRPKNHEKEFSLAQIREHLEKLIGERVEFAGSLAEAHEAKGKIILVENLRYNPAEEKGGEELAKQLAGIADYYINDAFSCSHRAHASISVVGKFTKVYAGFLMMKEISNIEAILGEKQGSALAIVGGSKVSTKIDLLKNLIHRLEYIFIAGGMANTFLYAQGFNVGASLCERDFKEKALEILKEAESVGCKIILPKDVIVCKKIEKFASSKMVLVSEVRDGDIIVDAGNMALAEVSQALEQCKLFLWNGPLGVFEVPPFGVSTFALARDVAYKTAKGELTSIIGGGDTASAVLQSGFKNEMSFCSTAGGAFLEWLEGKELPGVLAVKI